MAKIVWLFLLFFGQIFSDTEAQSEPINPEALKRLAHIGIEYTFKSPYRPPKLVKEPEPWEGGVLFLDDFEQKTKVFRKWLEPTLIKPSNIVIIDGIQE